MTSVCLGVFFLICLLETSYGLTIRLIHRDSPESPLYQPNLTSAERVERLVMQTKSRRFGGTNSTSRILSQNPLQSKVIRSRVDIVANPLYVAQLGIGTLPNNPSYAGYFVQVDPGSELLWLQCEDCMKPEHHCFTQTVPLFPSSHSQTYNPLPCNQHELCYPDECVDGKCSYEQQYMDQTSTLGYLAQEKFTFPSSTPQHFEQVRLVFGCGIENTAPVFERLSNKVVAGVMGLGWGPRSLVNQIGFQSQGRFSYCLQSVTYGSRDPPPSTYLRFGSDIQIPPGTHLHTTRLYEYEAYQEAYYVTLLGISVNNNRLRIPRHYLSKTDQGGGCVVDLGTGFSELTSPAYDILKQAIESYVARAVTSLTITNPIRMFDLCFQRNSRLRGFRNLPHITFHFQGRAELEMPPQSAFYGEVQDHSEIICLAIVPSLNYHQPSIIGGYSQTNQIFVFDTWGKQLSFGYHDCNQNP